MAGTDNIDDLAPVVFLLQSGIAGTDHAYLWFQGASETIGSLEGNGKVVLGTDTVSHKLTFGGNDYSTEFFGCFTEAAEGRGSVEKKGSGAFTMWGEGRYMGTTTVSDGDYQLHGTLESGNVVVSGANAIFSGTGYALGTVTVQGGGTLSPGASPGILTVGGLDLRDGTLALDINGTTAGTLYDRLVVTEGGGVKLDDAASLLTLNVGYTPELGDSYLVIENLTGTAVDGAFMGLPEGQTFTADGYLFEITYSGGAGNDVLIRYIPEPGALWLVLLGSVSLVLRRKLRVRRA